MDLDRGDWSDDDDSPMVRVRYTAIGYIVAMIALIVSVCYGMYRLSSLIDSLMAPFGSD